MPHLVGEGVGVTHRRDFSDGGIIQDALGGPEDLGGSDGGTVPVDGVEELLGEGLTRGIELLREILRHVIGEGGTDQVDDIAGDEAADLGIEGRTVISGIGALGPLEGGGQRGGEVKGQRRLIGVMGGLS